MKYKSIASACVGVGMSLLAASTIACAADLAVYKAPQPLPEPTLDIHGFFDLTFSNAYITPRGLLVTNSGLTTQILNGLAFDLYKDKYGIINNVSVNFGTWNDLWSEQNSPTVGSWNEFDWFVGGRVTFAQYWKAGVTYVVFLSPPGNFRQERNLELSLGFEDGALTGWPVSINPYVKWFNAISGDSTVVVGSQGHTYDVELGIVPTLPIKKYTGVPLTFIAPTWVTVGPATYWNRGITGCGAVATAPCSLSNAGVFSTGLTAKLALEAVPSRWGQWYAKAGFQYYHLINDSLLLAQTFTGTAASYLTAHRDVWTWTAGFGFGF